MNSRKVHLHLYHISRYYDDDGGDNLMIVVHRKEEKKIHSECCLALSLSHSPCAVCAYPLVWPLYCTLILLSSSLYYCCC